MGLRAQLVVVISAVGVDILLRQHVVRPLPNGLLDEVVILRLIGLPLLLSVGRRDLIGVGLRDALHVLGDDLVLAHHGLVVALAVEGAGFVRQGVVLLPALRVVGLFKIADITIERILMRVDAHTQVELRAVLAFVLVLVKRCLLLLTRHALVLARARYDLLLLDLARARLLREAALVGRWLHIVDEDGVGDRLARALGLHVVGERRLRVLAIGQRHVVVLGIQPSSDPRFVHLVT